MVNACHCRSTLGRRFRGVNGGHSTRWMPPAATVPAVRPRFRRRLVPRPGGTPNTCGGRIGKTAPRSVRYLYSCKTPLDWSPSKWAVGQLALRTSAPVNTPGRQQPIPLRLARSPPVRSPSCHSDRRPTGPAASYALGNRFHHRWRRVAVASRPTGFPPTLLWPRRSPDQNTASLAYRPASAPYCSTM